MNSVLPSPSLDIGLSVMSKGKPMQHQSLSSAWRKGTWIRRLSGMMLPPSMANNGVVSLILSLRASRANRGVTQGNGRGSRTNGGYGVTSPRSYARWHPDTSSWRMFLASLEGEPVTYSETWPAWGSMRSGVCSVRRAWEPPTFGSGFSFLPPTPTTMPEAPQKGSNQKATPPCLLDAAGVWPTPTAADAERHSNTYMRGNPTLIGAVRMWPTPTICGNENRRGSSPTSGDGLETAVKKWPTPRVGGLIGGSGSREMMGTKVRRGEISEEEATQIAGTQVLWRTPVARDFRETVRGAGNFRAHDKEGSLPDQAGGKLNPDWVEWLMGWPIGWTASEPLATGSYQQWLRQHLRYSTGG